MKLKETQISLILIEPAMRPYETGRATVSLDKLFQAESRSQAVGCWRSHWTFEGPDLNGIQSDLLLASTYSNCRCFAHPVRGWNGKNMSLRTHRRLPPAAVQLCSWISMASRSFLPDER